MLGWRVVYKIKIRDLAELWLLLIDKNPTIIKSGVEDIASIFNILSLHGSTFLIKLIIYKNSSWLLTVEHDMIVALSVLRPKHIHLRQ